MRIKSLVVSCVVLAFSISKSYAQPCTTLGQNPSTAFPVCGTNTFTQTHVPSCGGRNIPGACGPGAGLQDLNPFWYKFTCFTGGTLGFLITPFLASDDYDWQIFDITNRNPDDVFTDPALFVACNWSGFTGPTGATPAGLGLVHCAGNVPLISAMPTLIAGHEYLLLVSNFSNSNQGYTLVFNNGTASITDPVAPVTQTASINCERTQVTVRFNKALKCNSLTAAGTEFAIAPSGTIISATGFGCTAGFDMDSVLLTLSAPLPAGNYTVTMVNGSDANTLLDHCDRPITVGNNTAFTVPPPVPIPVGTVTPPPCAPNTITVTFADQLFCNSIAANGSDFVITGPSAVTVTGATAVNCTPAGYTNTITLQFAGPILTGGAYLVQIATGTDGNTLLGDCSRIVAAGITTPFNVIPQTPIPMGAVNPPACTPSSITLTLGEAVRCNSVAANGSDFTITGPSPVTILSAAPASCSAGETFEITIQFTAPILVTGTYQLNMATGSDGNTLLGNCSRQVAVGDNVPFTLAPQTPIAMGNIAPPPCAPTSITITFADPVLCNTLAANGSDFVVTGPSPVTVTGATATCNASGEATSITIQFASSILITGTYQVQMATGSDGNTLIGQCGRTVTAGSTTQFTLPAQPAIAMGNIPAPPCLPTSVAITFADPVFCNSIAANGSDFVITGPSAVTITGATATCNASGEATTITIQFAAPITVSGNYTVQMTNGSDGNTLIGQCGRAVTAGSNTQFTLAAQPAIAMGTIPAPPCLPTSVVITFADPVFCNSIAANGSDFVITGPSAVTITGATATCNASGEATTITIQFLAPITVSGNYTVQMANGSDGNTLIGQCGRVVTAGSTTQFTLAAQPAIAMGTIEQPPCLPTFVVIRFTDPILCNSVAANGSDFIITGPSGVTVTGATTTCNVAGEVVAFTIHFAAPIAVPGTYTVQLVTGSDGNTLIGQCGRIVTAGSTAQFSLPTQPPIAMGTIAQPPCLPTSVTITFADPVICNTIAFDGSDFIITGPSGVTVASATAACNAMAEINTITIQFTGAIMVPGTYTVQMATGTDGNTLVGQCGKIVPAGSTTQFTLGVQPPITMGTVPAPNCSPSSVTLNFTDNILCNSIAANGSDFTITGPAPVVITGTTATCNANGETNSITLQFAAPIIVSGTYQVQMVTGSDGNTLIGNCNRQTVIGDISPFTIPVAFPVPMDSIAPVACSPNSLRLVFDGPIRCASIAPNGSDFIVTGPNPVTVASASGTCDANGLATIITIQLASPIVVGGTYQVQLASGSDGNTLLSDCNRPTPAGSTLSFVTSDTVSAEFQYQVQYDCDTDVIDFSHNGQHNVNQWIWTVNGTAASTAQTFTQSFSASSQNQVQLVVSNGVCSDTYSTAINLNNKVTVDFTIPESVCPEDTAVFINTSTGPITNWQWTFGNGNNSSLQTPPAQVYPLTGIEMLYTVSLTGSNNDCQLTVAKTITVLSACIIAVPSAFTPNNDGLNDYLFPINAIKADNLDFKVFNRWGQLVFHSRDWRQKWDGRFQGVEQATNVFVWTLTYTHKDTGVKHSMRGTTTLIRK